LSVYPGRFAHCDTGHIEASSEKLQSALFSSCSDAIRYKA